MGFHHSTGGGSKPGLSANINVHERYTHSLYFLDEVQIKIT